LRRRERERKVEGGSGGLERSELIQRLCAVPYYLLERERV